MNINIQYNKTKTKNFYKDIISEYQKRLTSYCKLKLIDNQNKSCKSSYVVLIYINMANPSYKKAIEFTSTEFSEYIVNLGVNSHSDILFILADENEIVETDIEINDIITLSSLSLNSTLTLIILLEQLYRSYRIINNEPYHK